MSEMGEFMATRTTVAILEGQHGPKLTDEERRNVAIDIHTRTMQSNPTGTRKYAYARQRWLELFGR